MTVRYESGYRKKSAARLAAVQILYTKSMRDLSSKEALLSFQEHFMGGNIEESKPIKPDMLFLNELVDGVAIHEVMLTDLISGHLSGWTIKRLDPIVLNILKCAAFELLCFKETDAAVIISEYQDVTHAFLDEKEVGFVGGVLNSIAQSTREPTI